MFTSANYQKEIQGNPQIEKPVKMQDIRKSIPKKAIVMLCFTLFCALFGAIYELFSHEVYSYYMIYAFAIPLAGSVLPLMLLDLKGKPPADMTAISLWDYGIVTLTVGSLAKGALDIYGTANLLLLVYPAAALIFCLSAVILARVKKEPLHETTNI